MCADAFLLLYDDNGHAHGFLIGSAIYTKQVTSTKIDSQWHSTDPSRAYFTKTGKKLNPVCKTQRKRFTQLKYHRISGSLRIHVILPQGPGDKQILPCEVTGSDVIINLTCANFLHLFSFLDNSVITSFAQMLAKATATDHTIWSLPIQKSTKRSPSSVSVRNETRSKRQKERT